MTFKFLWTNAESTDRTTSCRTEIRSIYKLMFREGFSYLIGSQDGYDSESDLEYYL